MRGTLSTREGDQGECLSERFGSWTGNMRRREAVIRAYAGVGETQAQGGAPPGSTSAAAWGLEEAIGLPTDGLIELEFRRGSKDGSHPSEASPGLIPVEGQVLG